jgi:hypothetical protein
VALEYSTDNGASYTTMYSSGSGFGMQTNTCYALQCCRSYTRQGTGNRDRRWYLIQIEQLIFEIWCEVTT